MEDQKPAPGHGYEPQQQHVHDPTLYPAGHNPYVQNFNWNMHYDPWNGNYYQRDQHPPFHYQPGNTPYWAFDGFDYNYDGSVPPPMPSSVESPPLANTSFSNTSFNSSKQENPSPEMDSKYLYLRDASIGATAPSTPNSGHDHSGSSSGFGQVVDEDRRKSATLYEEFNSSRSISEILDEERSGQEKTKVEENNKERVARGTKRRAKSEMVREPPIRVPRKQNGDEDDSYVPPRSNSPSVMAAIDAAREVPQYTEPEPGHAFCKVQGRLTLVGNSALYTVPVTEVHRRISPPEYLNRSLIGPLLRRGKIKGCGDALQTIMAQKGIEIATKKDKKRVNVTTLSGFIEGEAIQCAADHLFLIKHYFPFEEIAKVLLVQSHGEEQIRQKIKHFQSAGVMADEMLSLANEWCGGANGIEKACSADSPIRDFSIITHAFGPEEWRTFCVAIKIFTTKAISVFQEYIEYGLDSDWTHEQWSNRANINAPLMFKELAQMPGDLRDPLPSDHKECKTFCEIPGRLTLINHKYIVSVAEVRRRLKVPESLNTSTLGAILRRGKTRDNSTALRMELAKYDMEVPTGRRKCCTTTTFTAFAEEEACRLATDVREAIAEFFPATAIATLINKPYDLSTREGVNKRKNILIGTMETMSLLIFFLKETLLPVGDRVPIKRSQFEHCLEPYHIITHGFGPPETCNWLETTLAVADAAIQLLHEESFPSFPDAFSLLSNLPVDHSLPPNYPHYASRAYQN